MKNGDFPVRYVNVYQAAYTMFRCFIDSAAPARGIRKESLKLVARSDWRWKNGESSPTGEHTKSYWKWPFIVDFPIKNGDFPLPC